MEQIDKRELISALADGQLQGEAFAKGVELAVRDESALEAWRMYHLIGDVLRSPDLASGTASAEFVGKVQARLEREERLALRAFVPVAAPPSSEAANDGVFRWKMVAGFASLAAIGAIGWGVLSSGGAPAGPSVAAEVASAAPSTVLVGSERGVVIRDPRLDEMLAAHRQLGGATALQSPQGFLRNATFDNSSR